MAKNTEANRLECNIKARNKYIKNNYRQAGVRFNLKEFEVVEKFCEEKKMSRYTLMKTAVFEYIENHSDLKRPNGLDED